MEELQNKVNAVKSFFNWLETFLQKQFGIFLLILSIVCIGLYYGHLRYNEGIKQGKDINADRVTNLYVLKEDYRKEAVRLKRKVDSLELTASKIDVLGEAHKRLEESRRFENLMKTKYLNEKKDNNELEKLLP